MTEREILNIDEAAELLGVSVKTFNKVLHRTDMPARKVGREWKFSRRALIDWVGSGRASDFYRGGVGEEAEEAVGGDEIVPAPRARLPQTDGVAERVRARRTAGWQIED